MKLTNLRFALFLTALLVPASIASPDNLTPGSGWQYFSWSNCTKVPCSTTPTWTVDLTSATGPTELRVVDAFAGGDMFAVTVYPYPPPAGGTLSTQSSWVPLSTDVDGIGLYGIYTPLVAEDDVDAAWSLSKYFSRLDITLPAGYSYTITITNIQLARDPETFAVISSGGAFIRASCVGAAGTGCPADTATMDPSAMMRSAVAPMGHGAGPTLYTINGALKSAPRTTR